MLSIVLMISCGTVVVTNVAWVGCMLSVHEVDITLEFKIVKCSV